MWIGWVELEIIFDFELGDYVLMIVDVNGCEGILVIVKVLECEVLLVLDSFVVQQVFCFEVEDVVLMVYMSGGFE